MKNSYQKKKKLKYHNYQTLSFNIRNKTWVLTGVICSQWYLRCPGHCRKAGRAKSSDGKDGNDDPICKTEKKTQMYRTDFWTLLEKARVGCFKRTASKHVYYLGWNRSPAQVGCMRQVLGPGALGRKSGKILSIDKHDCLCRKFKGTYKKIKTKNKV